MTPWQFHIGVKEKQFCMKKVKKKKIWKALNLKSWAIVFFKKDINSGTEVISSVPSINNNKKKLSNKKQS